MTPPPDPTALKVYGIRTWGQLVEGRLVEPSEWCPHVYLREDADKVFAQQAEEIARWREAAYFAAKARNLRALRDRVAAGEAVTAVAEDYRVPAEWVTAITHPGWDLLSGDAAHAQQAEEIARLKRVIAMEAQVYRRASAELELHTTNCARLTQALLLAHYDDPSVLSANERSEAIRGILAAVAALAGEKEHP